MRIPGEAETFNKEPKSKDWSGLSLPQISYGYESLITLLQTLTLYNAIANDGKMVKPRFERKLNIMNSKNFYN